ncbi:MAG: hypothetical protein ACYTEZ_14265 [Planctomycetota bacterium]|jgi:hypothetical protein
MDREAKLALLGRVLHDTVNSVIQYLDAATPYVPPGCVADVEQVQRMRDEERATAAALTDHITALDGVPRVGVFDYWNVDLNYLDFRFLARFAARHLDGVIAGLETSLGPVQDDPPLHALLSKILAEKRAHREALLVIANRPGPPVDPELKEKVKPKDPQHVPRPVRD